MHVCGNMHNPQKVVSLQNKYTLLNNYIKNEVKNTTYHRLYVVMYFGQYGAEFGDCRRV